jgi:hypothetical protein
MALLLHAGKLLAESLAQRQSFTRIRLLVVAVLANFHFAYF